MRVGGIILSGGLGKRFGSEEPKQFLKLGNKSVIEYSLEKFRYLDIIIVVTHPDWQGKLKELLVGFPSDKFLITLGGDTRQLSVRNGLLKLQNQDIDHVVIHDGARPFLSSRLLEECISSSFQFGSGVAALPDMLTTALVEGHRVEKYLDRDKIHFIQTPQAFNFKKIFLSHQLVFEEKKWDYTDDSQIFEKCGYSVDIVKGDEHNIKITTPFDWIIAEQVLKRLEGLG